MPIPLHSVSISARAVINLHSLNNEGTEGNQTHTRMVSVYVDGRLHNVNAISGDMFKHIQSEHLHRLAIRDGLPLSEGARLFNANRINYDLDQNNFLKGVSTNSAAIDLILQRCAVTDLAGTLVTSDNRSLPRKSVVEFGWVVGIPNNVRTDAYFHVKYESERGGGSAAIDESGSVSGRQAIFHRPASSGAYAVVLQIEASRVGFNDIAQRYAIPRDERKRRLRALLESVLHTFVEPAGAMRTAQNPHLSDFEGVIAISKDVVPAPCVSPLRADFANELRRIADNLNRLRSNAVELRPFASLGEFTEQMSHLIKEADLFDLPVAAQAGGSR